MTPKSLALGIAILLLLLFFAWCSEARAQVVENASVTLTWNPHPDPDVVQYTLWYGVSWSSYSVAHVIEAEEGVQPEATVTGLTPGNWIFFVTAESSTGGSSPRSNALGGEAKADGTFEVLPTPAPVQGIRFVILQASSDLQTWTNRIAMLPDPNEGRMFWRLTTDEIPTTTTTPSQRQPAVTIRAAGGDRAVQDMAPDADPRPPGVERIPLGEDPVDEAGRSEDQD